MSKTLDLFTKAHESKVAVAEKVCEYAQKVEGVLKPFRVEFTHEIGQGETLSWKVYESNFRLVHATLESPSNMPVTRLNMDYRIKLGIENIEAFVEAYAKHLKLK